MQNTKYPMVTSENDRFWSRYCGFFDLSLSQFMVIQETTLMQHLQRVAASDLGKDIMGSRPPQSVEEFRNRVPLTTYEDYIPYFREDRVSALPARPHVWAHTSSGSRSFKLVPYTTEFYNRQLDSLMAVLILSCSKRKGQSSIQEYDRVLHNVAPMPYLSGILASGASERFNLVPIITPDEHDGLDFKEKVAKGFELSLASGVDIIIAMTSVLVKMGHDFNRRSSRSQKSQYLAHPKVLCRYARAWLRSRLRGRNILPKDLWPVRSVIGWGTDTRIYREQVREYWGTYPYEFHACTEAGIMAMQSWNRGDLTLLPYSNFFEFIPESEWLENKRNSQYQPRTVLLPDVQPGERYEIVITSFHDMPFIRYRLGHLVKFTALADREAPVNLPQMVFEARADDLIDIAGFTRISEKTMAETLSITDFGSFEWTLRKEFQDDKPVLHLYLERQGTETADEVARVLQAELTGIDSFYHDLEQMMDIRPLQVTMLRAGTFRDYYEAMRQAGAELHQRTPTRINAPDQVIDRLLRLSQREPARAAVPA